MPDTPSSTGSPTGASVRARFAQALARRAAAHGGAARRVLDDKLAALTPSLADASEPTPDRAAPRPPHGPLAELVAQVARQKPSPVLAPAAKPHPATTDKTTSAGPAADPKTLQFFKRTWSRLSADQRLAQSRASLPENAGPLNSQHLVHRSLTLMQSLSPDYLERFVAYIDALQWLEQANEAAESAVGLRTAGSKRSMPARR